MTRPKFSPVYRKVTHGEKHGVLCIHKLSLEAEQIAERTVWLGQVERRDFIACMIELLNFVQHAQYFLLN